MTDVAARKVNWQQVGRAAKPGRYLFTFGWLTISDEDLAIWRTHPHAAFTLVPFPTTPDVPPEFHLGAFELHDDEKTEET
jgi:hypothetical protein